MLRQLAEVDQAHCFCYECPALSIWGHCAISQCATNLKTEVCYLAIGHNFTLQTKTHSWSYDSCPVARLAEGMGTDRLWLNLPANSLATLGLTLRFQ